MTDTPQPASPIAAESRVTRGARTGLLVGVAAAVVVAAVTVGILLTRDDSSRGTPQLASTHGACRQWVSSYTPSQDSAPSGAWCTAMTNWMRRELRSGHMTGPMMWSDATTMRSTCRQWMSTSPAAASGVSPQACDDMATWMDRHAGNWFNWMMTGRMMGR